MRQLLSVCLICLSGIAAMCQTNISLSNTEAAEVLSGNYDPTLYLPSVIINHPDSVVSGINGRVNGDTLMSWLETLVGFQNRNTGSDTVSSVRGIGAARRWIYSKMEGFSQANENRLVLSWMDFDASVCAQGHHRNVLAILPGMDTSDKEIIVVEGHFDTRCEAACDTACFTPGADDNGSGTVLVMELARIMSRYAFSHTIVFACLTGEDQGLYGSKAFANYLYAQNIKVRACLNNDVVGGILCGATSSPPSCTGFGNVDSTRVRIFSYSPANDSFAASAHKQLARYIRLQQEERINPLLSTPMLINLMIYEDRIGRSGDQVPFRQKGYTAVRYCSQNEHGNGSGTPPDHQHTSSDIIGVDTSFPPDGIIDSFFVDRNYLRRNAISNGVNAGLLAMAPQIPVPDFSPLPDGVQITLHGNDSAYLHYCVGIRTRGSASLYFDTVRVFTASNIIDITGLDPLKETYISIANVKDSVEGLFCNEFRLFGLSVDEAAGSDISSIVLQNNPNPFSNFTSISVIVPQGIQVYDLFLRISDIAGREIWRMPVNPIGGETIIKYIPENGTHGIYLLTLFADGRKVSTKKMVIW